MILTVDHLSALKTMSFVSFLLYVAFLYFLSLGQRFSLFSQALGVSSGDGYPKSLS